MAGGIVTAAEALKTARAAGVTVRVEAGALALEAAREPPAVVLALLAQHKREIVELLLADAANENARSEATLPADPPATSQPGAGTVPCAKCGTVLPSFAAIVTPEGCQCARCRPPNNAAGAPPASLPVSARAPVAAPSDADAAVLAEALMAEAERNSAVTITDRAQARLYWQGEARRRLDLIRQRAAAAVTGPDIERVAIRAEEHAPMAAAKDQAETVAGLLRAAAVHRMHGRAEHPTNPDLEQHVEPA